MQAVQLSPFDHMARYNYIRYILCFACDESMVETRKSRWQSVLSSLVRMYPFLAGKVTDLSGHQIPKLHMNLTVPSTFDVVAQGMLRFAECDLCYSDLREAQFPPSLLRSEHLHWLPVAPLPGDQQVFTVQATFVRGGLLVAMWWHHSVIDGYGACTILQGLGRLIRAMSLGTDDELVPQLGNVGRKSFHDHDHMLAVTDSDIEEMVVRNQSSTDSNLSLEAVKTKSPQKRVVSRVFGFNLADIQRIKRSDARMASPFRCAIALLLVAILRVRSSSRDCADEKSLGRRLFILVDVRTALKAPSGFLGNSVHGKFLKWDIQENLQTSQDLVELPACLTLALDRICATINAVKQPSFMAKRLAFMHRHYNPDSQLGVELKLREDDSYLICNSWEEVGMVCAGIDFEAVGLGTLDHVRRPYAANSGSLVVLPKLTNSAVIEVDVGLPEQEMLGLLDELEGWKRRGWLKHILE